jgi:hypothetical protein
VLGSVEHKMNEKPRLQVLTAGGAGSKKSALTNRNNTTKQSNKEPSQSTESSSNVSELHNIQPSMSQNYSSKGELEYEVQEDDGDVEDIALNDGPTNYNIDNEHRKQHSDNRKVTFSKKLRTNPIPPPKFSPSTGAAGTSDLIWLTICFVGIMASFVCYGLLLEYTTSGGRKLHELSFLFVTSGLYTVTAAAGRYVRDETPTTIPPRQFALLGLTSMGSTWCSVRSLRYDGLSFYLQYSFCC